MRNAVDGQRASQPEALPANPIHIRDLPAHWFTPSEELEVRGWPDFGVSSLADWTSSSAPAPSVPDDCCLVLAFPRVVQPIEATGGWIYALHETGGIWQERKRIIAKRLEIGQRGTQIIHAIARAMAHSNCAAEFALFDQLVEYRQLLNRAGLDCNHHIQALAEGFYPIDPVEEALQILDLVDPPAEALAHIGGEQLCLAILAPNSPEW
ncbi:MAG: hypothetical protein J0G94_06465 [Sphingomonadales bacterium]|nr:hypothetical protein [Sphingomonadales bacterium]